MKKLTFIILVTLLSVSTIYAQIPNGYYNNANGLSGTELKTALHKIIRNHTELSYTPGVWNAYYTTDRKANGKIWDMYSDVPGGTPAYEFTYATDQCYVSCSNASVEGCCYSREHSFPKSWWGGATDTMYTDIFHLVPADQCVNNKRSNNPYGEVASPSWTSSNGSKYGNCTFPGYTGIVFEPIDSFKGDLARNYFYMATRYMHRFPIWYLPSDPDRSMIGPVDFSPWALQLLLHWNQIDPVSKKEIDRNNAVYALQGNRNPFIDHPEYVGYIWGGSNPVPPAVTNPALTKKCKTTMDLSWTLPSGYNTSTNTILVFVKAGSAINSGTPTNTVNSYVANSDFSAGGTAYQLDANAKCIYKGDGVQVSVSGLNANTAYYFLIYNVADPSSYSTGVISNASTLQTIQNATNLSATGNDGSITLSWSLPDCFDEFLIAAKAGSSITSTPTGNGSLYIADPNFSGSGSIFDVTGKVVYKDNGTFVEITGLTNNTTYYLKIFTRKGTDWSSGAEITGIPQISNNTPFQGFETTANDGWIVSSGFAQSSDNSGYPASRIKSGIYSYQVNNTTGTLVFNGVSTTGLINSYVEIWNSSVSITSANGADQTDYIKVWVSQTATYGTNPDISVFGYSNLRYTMYGTGEISTTAGTPVTYNYTVGGSLNDADAKSKLKINIPSDWTMVYLKIEAKNDNLNEVWCIDDVALKGTQTCTPQNATSVGTTGANGEIQLNWTNPQCFDNIMVVCKPNSSITLTPSGDGSAYSYSQIYGNGSAYDGGYVVYKGTGTTQTISNLINGTTYYFKVFSRKSSTWSSGVEVNGIPVTPPPAANFSATPLVISAGASVTFTDLSTYVPTSWLWSFGDGGSSTIQNPVYTYNNPGVYSVSLSATNAGGSNTFTRTGYITVNAAKPIARFKASNTIISESESINFTDTSANTPTSWKWTFTGGNPSTSTVQNPQAIFYLTPGVYNVKLVASNSSGSDSITKSNYITVNSYTPTTTNLVLWNFPNNPDDSIADGGTAVNLNKYIKTVGANTSTFNVGGATTNAATATGWLNGMDTKYWQIEVNTSGYNSIKISSKQKSSNTGPKDFKLQYKIGTTGTWADVTGGSITVANDLFLSGVLNALSLPTEAENQNSVFIRWIMTSNNAVSGSLGSGGTSRIDDILLSGNQIAPANISWTGGNGYWNVASNWSNNTIPDSTTNIVISGNPIINSSAKCKNIIIPSGNSLTINPNQNLNVFGNWNNYGNKNIGQGNVIFKGSSSQSINGITKFENLDINNFNSSDVIINDSALISGILTITQGTLKTNNKLRLLSTVTQSALISGTGNGNIVGNVIIDKYLTSNAGYRYISTPFSNSIPLIDFDAAQVYNWNETTHSWLDYSDFDAQTGKGYAARFTENPPMITVYNTVNNGNINIPLTYSGSSANDENYGWNLIGNPYPSPVDWNSLGWTKTNISQALYFFHATSYNSGTYHCYITLGGNGYGLPTTTNSIIPSMQGFFVKTTNSNPILTVNNTARINNTNSNFYRTITNPAFSALRLKVVSNENTNYNDETLIYFHPLATIGYNNNLDAVKLLNTDDNYPNIYTSTDNQTLAINALPDNENEYYIPLNIKLNNTGNYILKASEIINMDNSASILLIYNNESFNLKVNDYVFNNTSVNTTFDFILKVTLNTNIGVNSIENNSKCTIYQNNKNLYVDNYLPGNLKIIDILGNVVLNENIIDSGVHIFNLSYINGIYIAQFSNKYTLVQKKLIIENINH